MDKWLHEYETTTRKGLACLVTKANLHSPGNQLENLVGILRMLMFLTAAP